MATQHQAWTDHPPKINDPTCKFSLAWGRLRNTYRSMQEQIKNTVIPLEDQQARLVQLKLEILEDSATFQKDDFHLLRT